MPKQRGAQHQRLRDPAAAMTDGALQRISYTAGVVSMAQTAYTDLRTLAADTLTKIVKASADIAKYAKRARINCDDVEEAIRVTHGVIPYLPRVLRSGDEGEVKRCDVGSSKTTERKVAFYQKQSACVHFSRDGFERLIRSALGDYEYPDLQLSKDAIGILHLTIEAYLVRVMSAANRLVVHAERKTLMSKDIAVALNIGGSA